jgi:hypothetical protein
MTIISSTRCAFASDARENFQNFSAGENKRRNLLNKFVVERETSLGFKVRYVQRRIPLILRTMLLGASYSHFLYAFLTCAIFINWSRGPWVRLGPGLIKTIKNGLLHFVEDKVYL